MHDAAWPDRATELTGDDADMRSSINRCRVSRNPVDDRLWQEEQVNPEEQAGIVVIAEAGTTRKAQGISIGECCRITYEQVRELVTARYLLRTRESSEKFVPTT
jgi:hypothetical protein